MAKQLTRTALICLAAGHVACDGDDSTIPGSGGVDRPPLLWDGEHIRIHSWRDLDDWCPATTDGLDAYAGALADKWGTSAAAPFDYYLLDHPVPSTTPCGKDGCKYEIDGEVVVLTPYLPHQHEVAHAVGARSRRLPLFFEEGLALYWSEPRVIPNSGVEGFDVQDVYERSWDNFSKFTEQVVAAHFVSYLIHADETAAAELLQVSSAARDDFEREFETIFGINLAGAFSDYEESYDVGSTCTLADLRSSFFECSGPTVGVLGDESVVVDTSLSCDDLRTTGPSGDAQPTAKIWQDVVFDVAETGDGDAPRLTNVEFASAPPTGAESIQVRFKRCDTDCAAVAATRKTLLPYPNGEEAGIHVLELPPGRYVARVARDASLPGPVRFELR